MENKTYEITVNLGTGAPYALFAFLNYPSGKITLSAMVDGKTYLEDTIMIDSNISNLADLSDINREDFNAYTTSCNLSMYYLYKMNNGKWAIGLKVHELRDKGITKINCNVQCKNTAISITDIIFFKWDLGTNFIPIKSEYTKSCNGTTVLVFNKDSTHPWNKSNPIKLELYYIYGGEKANVWIFMSDDTITILTDNMNFHHLKAYLSSDKKRLYLNTDDNTMFVKHSQAVRAQEMVGHFINNDSVDNASSVSIKDIRTEYNNLSDNIKKYLVGTPLIVHNNSSSLLLLNNSNNFKFYPITNNNTKYLATNKDLYLSFYSDKCLIVTITTDAYRCVLYIKRFAQECHFIERPKDSSVSISAYTSSSSFGLKFRSWRSSLIQIQEDDGRYVNYNVSETEPENIVLHLPPSLPLKKGTTQERPIGVEIGFIYKDTTLNKLIVWDGNAWVNMDGSSLDIKKSGATNERPTNVDIGFVYKDTTLSKLILWEGNKWVNLDGTELT